MDEIYSESIQPGSCLTTVCLQPLVLNNLGI